MAATVKGSVVSAGHDYMRRAYGEPTWQRVLGHLTPDERALVMHGRQTLQFPVAVDGKVFSALVAEQFEGNRIVTERELRKGGAAQADDMLNGVFSIFARLASPRQAFKRAGSIVTSVYTEVTHATEEDADGGGGVIYIRGLGESPYVSPWQCGWIERALLHFGSTDPRVVERSWQAGRNASDELAYEVRF